VVSSAAIDSLGFSRSRAGWLGGAAIALAGIPGALSSDWVGFLFQLVGQACLVLGGLLLALIVGYVWKDSARAELLAGFDHPGLASAWIWLLRTVVPVMLAVTLYFSVVASSASSSGSGRSAFAARERRLRARASAWGRASPL
jgi:NSS family neurotransmitter:Na+ symporter